jgi:hypothetical protein
MAIRMIKARTQKITKSSSHSIHYPRAAREVIVTFAEMPTTKDTQPIEDKALKLVNTALLTSDLKKRASCGARFSLALNLVLTTGLHDNNAELVYQLTLTLKISVKT